MAAGVLQGRTGYLGRVNDASLNEVGIFALLSVKAPVALALPDVFQYYLTRVTGVFGNKHQRLAQGVPN